jgi:secondary thiamine-phosphate synthase enzyme
LAKKRQINWTRACSGVRDKLMKHDFEISGNAVRSASMTIQTRGREIADISHQIQAFVAQSGLTDGLCNVFIHHTSASLILCENADPTVLQDAQNYFARLVKDGDSRYRHSDEGPDDMSAHIRSILTLPSVSIPVARGKLSLGTWQGIFIWEHRSHSHRRTLTISAMGDFLT